MTRPLQPMKYLPVDNDSREEVLIRDSTDGAPEPNLSDGIRQSIDDLVLEWSKRPLLTAARLTPIRSVLFAGDPGVGKTMCARWLAGRLKLPLLRVNLATIFNSHLGCTGHNINHIFKAVNEHPCVLFIDELDALGVQRGNEKATGEIHRITLALMQSMDAVKDHSLIVAATNRLSDLDAAVVRRFEMQLEFPLPDAAMRYQFIRELTMGAVGSAAMTSLAERFDGRPYSYIATECNRLRKRAILSGRSLSVVIEEYAGKAAT